MGLPSRALLAATVGLLAACSASGRGGGAGAASAGASGSGGGAVGGSGASAGTSAGAGGSGGASAAGVGGGTAGAAGAPEPPPESTDGATSGPSDASDGGADAADAGAHLTLPITRGNLEVLEVGGLKLTVDPSVGARVTSFSLDGDEMLTDATANPNYWGSTLWTSPASDWVVPGTFVPLAVVDNKPYATTVSADGVITATSGAAIANGKHFTVAKVFHADLAKNAIVIDYQLTNTGTAAFRLSHWEVTRVFPNGLTFFPSGTMTKLDFLPQLVQFQQAQGYTWYDNSTHMMGKGESKAGTDSPGGFIAQVASHAKGPLLFIKAFKAITVAQEPPGHYPIELYCNDPHTYVELEDHSSYDMIAPGATYTQTVTWFLRRLPTAIDRSVGSTALVNAALQTLGR
jgi:hypothetical protein